MKAKNQLLQIYVLFSSSFLKLLTCQLFPNSSVFQLTGSVSVPVQNLPKTYRILFDWGLQMNYNLPFQVSSFYSIPIWPGAFDNNLSGKRSWSNSSNYNSLKNIDENIWHWDYSAEEFYRSLDQLLCRYDVHKSCLLLSICELALHPFDNQEKNIFTEMLTLILTPSMHVIFEDTATDSLNIFKTAEVIGSSGKNCLDIYPNCNINLFDIFTRVQF